VDVPVYCCRQTSTYVGDRQREHSERVVTIGRPVRDIESEVKSVPRSEKSERPRVNDHRWCRTSHWYSSRCLI